MEHKCPPRLPLASASSVGKAGHKAVPGGGPLRYLVGSALSLTQCPPRRLLPFLPRRYARGAWKVLQILAAFLVALCLTRRKLMGDYAHVEDRSDVQKIADLQMNLRKLPPLWPAPRLLNVSLKQTRVLDGWHFRITSNTDCDVVTRAIVRYRNLTLPSSTTRSGIDGDRDAPANLLSSLHVGVRRHNGANNCGYPPPKANERYTLTIPASGDAKLTSETVWGALRGLETFSQMVLARPNERYAVVNSGEVRDFPRFSHRGILMDTARHFLPVAIIKQNLDAMAYNKFNVLHWHLVDDQSWPFHMSAFPNLTAVGAYSKRHVYSEEDVRGVVEYARLRGIRVIPEIDTPGHTHALGRAFPDALTPCYGNGSRGTASLGQHGAFEMLDPTKNLTYSLVQSLISQVAKVFKDPYVHLGMDEVYYDCWRSSPQIRKFQSQRNLRSTNEVEQHYVERTLDNIVRSGLKVVIWQDPIENNVEASPNATVVQVWKAGGWSEFVASIARRGHPDGQASGAGRRGVHVGGVH
ncbi:beta-hexosaminidase subunit beta-like isoform X2 [Amblyomma americanum]